MDGKSPTCSYSSFAARFGLALQCFWKALFDPPTAKKIALALNDVSTTSAARPQPELPPERQHASGLYVLSLLQREGRLIDFLQEEVASFSDAEVGAAARVVHVGCKKAISQCFELEPVLKDAEGAAVNVPAGFDARRIRLTGNVAGQPPFRGALKHHGWVATAVRLPAISEALDPRVIAAAEIEL